MSLSEPDRSPAYSVFISSFYLLILLFLSIYFFRERTIMPDTSFQLFELLRNDHFSIQTGRYGAFINQVLPLAVARSGGHLKAILISYSLTFTLLPLAIFLVQLGPFKNPKMALVVVLFSSLLVVHTFFWVQSELITACLYLLLGWGFVHTRNEPIQWHWLWLLPLLVLGLITHPLALIPHIYIGIFFLTGTKNRLRSGVWYFTLAGLLIVLMKWSLLTIHAYDATAAGLSQNAFLRFYRFFEWQSTRQFLSNCLRLYLPFFPLFGWIIYYYWRSGEKAKLALFLSATLGYLVLVNGTYSWGGVIFHMEAFYQILAVFLALPLVFDIFPTLTGRWRSVAISLLLVHSLFQIANTGRFYKQRNRWISDVMNTYQSAGYNKVLLPVETVPMDTLLLEWGLPYETALLSELKKNQNTFSAVVNRPDAPFKPWKMDKHVYLHTFGAIPYSELNRLPYFNFRDTALYLEVRAAE
ncbi:MAG: hypothetical protein R2824_29270 [Saprospiraceae bacterium]|nr:hypothetical protein [Lewinella sp.]